MLRDGLCQCDDCMHEIDPTVAFQVCDECEGRLTLRVRRYVCQQCGRDVDSQFLFDGLVFDRAYFRQKMQESRQRTKQKHREQYARRVFERSEPIEHGPADVDGLPGLVEALNGLLGGCNDQVMAETRERFSLAQYEDYLLAQLVADDETSLRSIAGMRGNDRSERIRLFIAAIFLAHRGLIDIRQHGDDIMVTPLETHRERQAIPDNAETADGNEGYLGRTAA